MSVRKAIKKLSKATVQLTGAGTQEMKNTGAL
jgi:hypothetical protein